MSLKSIRESYSRFLTVLKDAGVKINESQKADLDSFILAVEAKMSKQKELAIKATKKVVTEHLEKQYRKVFESLFENLQQNAALSAKIATKAARLDESKKISQKVSNYLDLYVESVLPKKTIVDYDRMQRLEKIHESLKDMLVADDDAVKAKKQKLEESFDLKRKELETQIAKLQVKLNESMDKSLKLNKKIDSFKAMELLESKTKDLPPHESEQIKRRFKNATTVEIEKNFKKVYESIKEEIKEKENNEETSLEEEVKGIIEGEDDVKENDILKNRKHNGHVDEGEKDGKCPECGKSPCQCEGEEDIDEEEVFETRESVQFDENGEVILDGLDRIDESQMDQWCTILNKR